LVLEHGSKNLAIGFDPSFISKSGKKTFGLGYFWSGCASKVKLGLEISGIAAIDIGNQTAFHLEAVQTPENTTLKEEELNQLKWYAKILTDRKDILRRISNIVVADAFFSKKPFMDALLANQLHLTSRLRDDADLRYLYKGEQTGKRGANKKYAGKINFKKLDLNYFQKIEQTEEHTLLCAVVNSKSLKRNIKLVIMLFTDKNGNQKHKLYFSTDLEIDGLLIFNIYHHRFQMEFLYRDGKQFTGLNDCQARDEAKLNYHFNASLTSLNIAKIAHWLSIEKNKRGTFSMSDIKTMNHNVLLLEQFISKFGIDADAIKNQNIIKELINFGKILTERRETDN